MKNSLPYASYVFKEEAKAILNLENYLTEDFNKAIEIILNTSGKVIVTGLGKSGHIGRKIAASLASTGTPSFFIHPAEAFHGDLGMFTNEDSVIAISNSGETDEVLRMVSFFNDNGNEIISITKNPESTLAKNSKAHINCYTEKEVCPLNLAPTTSATAALVIGDAIVVALMENRNFGKQDYAKFHPGGSLGKKLLSKVKDYMIAEDLPLISVEADIIELISKITGGRLGLCIAGSRNNVQGLITDGDLRRALEKYGERIFKTKIEEIMTESPLFIGENDSLLKAQSLMNEKKITALLVGSKNNLKWIIQYYDIQI
ncbi:MAG: KpsF/GutQ family sugar-phosphate isomerase [bacterium]